MQKDERFKVLNGWGGPWRGVSLPPLGAHPGGKNRSFVTGSKLRVSLVEQPFLMTKFKF